MHNPTHQQIKAIVYKSRNFKVSNVVKQYICVDVYGQIHLYDVDDSGYTIQQRIVSATLPSIDKLAEAMALKGKAFNQVQI